MSEGYRGLEALWHDLFWEAEEAPSEVGLMDDFLQVGEGKSLYVGSGSGRLLGPLVAAGHDLVGLEASPEMVALSRSKHPEAEVIKGRWEEFVGDEKYASVMIPAFTFQLFAEPELVLRRIRKMSDRLYLTLFFPWAEISGDLPEGEWYFDRSIGLATGEEGELETRHRLFEKTGKLARRHRYTLRDREGRVLRQEETKQDLRFFTDRDLKKLFARSGWEVEREIFNLGDEDWGDVVYVTTLFLRGKGV